MYISFLKEQRKLIGASTINTNFFDAIIDKIHFNRFMRHHRLSFDVEGFHKDIQELVFFILRYDGSAYNLMPDSYTDSFKDILVIIADPIEKNKLRRQ